MFAYRVLIIVLTRTSLDIYFVIYFDIFRTMSMMSLASSAPLPPPPPRLPGQILSIAYRFLQSICQIIGWCTPPRMGHALWDILDPPLPVVLELTKYRGLRNCHLMRNGQTNRNYTAKLVMSWTRKALETNANICDNGEFFAGHKL